MTCLPKSSAGWSAFAISASLSAIFQNLEYMENYNPDYVLILSGDHIYKMDYEVMLDFHKESGSEVTFDVRTPSREPCPPAKSMAIISFLIMLSPLLA